MNEIRVIEEGNIVMFVLREGKVARTVEREPDIHVDLDADGRPLSIEFIGARECPIWAAARVFEEFGLTVAPSELLAS